MGIRLLHPELGVAVMVSRKRFTIKGAFPLLVIGLLIFIAYLYFFVGIGEIAGALRRANLFYYSLAFIAVFVEIFFYALAWQRFLVPLSVKVPFRKTFLYVWVGLFVDLLVPAESVSGEISKAYLMVRGAGGNAGKVVASIVGHRILNMIIILGSLIVGTIAFIVNFGLPVGLVLGFLILVMVGVGVSIFFLIFLSVREQATQKMIDWILRLVVFISRGRWSLDNLRAKSQKMLRVFHQGIEVLGKNPKNLVQPTVFTLTAWLFSVLIHFLVFLSLNYQVSPGQVIIVFSIINAIQAIPLGVPGEVGLTEIVMTTSYHLIGIDIEISAAATVLIRVLTLWFRLLIGYVITQWVGIKALTGNLE